MDLRFGDFRLNARDRQLTGPAGIVETSARGFDILAALLARPHEIVSKDELLAAAWPGAVVEENTLQVHMSAVRKALPADMIVTVHGRGYKYAGPVPSRDAPVAAGEEFGRKPVIVVLPFDNLSADPEQQYFSDGIAGDIADRLVRFRTFTVIGQHSAAHFRAASPDIAAIRERLKADFVVMGSVRRGDERIRIATRLCNASTGSSIWGEQYNRPVSDLFDLQDEISQLIAAAIARHLEIEVNIQSTSRPPTSLSSHEHMQRGYWHFKKLNQAGNAAARQSFERAVDLDPGNAHALAWLGVTFVEDWQMDFSLENAERGAQLISRAAALDPASGLIQAGHAWARLCNGDLTGALASRCISTPAIPTWWCTGHLPLVTPEGFPMPGST
jgi:TolB-like protein